MNAPPQPAAASNNRALSGPQQMELQRFAQQQQQQVQIQAAVSKLTTTCWKKCINEPTQEMSKEDIKCMHDCAAAFLDTSVILMNKVAGGAPQEQ